MFKRRKPQTGRYKYPAYIYVVILPAVMFNLVLDLAEIDSGLLKGAAAV